MPKAKYSSHASSLHALMKLTGSRTTPPSKPPRPSKGTKLTVLGCGSSTGVPILSCRCETCRSKNPKNKRTRASVVFQVGPKVLLIDTSPDLREQAMRETLYWIDAVLFTHPHADHIHGIDELRAYNFLMRKVIPCFGNEWSVTDISKKFDYIFRYTQEGGGKPAIDLHVIAKPMRIEGVRVVPLPVIHGNMPVLGYRINNIAYITDFSYIPDSTLRLLKGLDALVLDCLRYVEHPTHVNLEQALEYVKRIGAKRTWLTHMSHDVEYKEFARQLPRNVFPAHDGLVIKEK